MWHSHTKCITFLVVAWAEEDRQNCHREEVASVALYGVDVAWVEEDRWDQSQEEVFWVAVQGKVVLLAEDGKRS